MRRVGVAKASRDTRLVAVGAPRNDGQRDEAVDLRGGAREPNGARHLQPNAAGNMPREPLPGSLGRRWRPLARAQRRALAGRRGGDLCCRRGVSQRCRARACADGQHARLPDFDEGTADDDA